MCRLVRGRRKDWIHLRTSSESLPSASLSTISITSSYNFSPDAYPCAQLFPAPPPSFDTNIFSGLYKFAHGDVNMLLITCSSSFNPSLVRHDDKTRSANGGGNTATYPRLEIDENGTRNVVLVVRLVEKHVLAIAAFRRPIFENAFFVDPVFGTQSLPVHGAHLIVISVFGGAQPRPVCALWFPHCPSWTVTISRGMMHDGRVQGSGSRDGWCGVQSKYRDDGGIIADLNNTQQNMQIRKRIYPKEERKHRENTTR
jgi:hypothetical protein